MTALIVREQFELTGRCLPSWLASDGPPSTSIMLGKDAVQRLVETLPFKRWPERSTRVRSNWMEAHNTVNWVAFILQCGGDIALEPCSCCASSNT